MSTSATRPLTSRALDALVKADIPSAMLLTEAGNIYCPVMKNSVIEDSVRSRPELVGFWAACYVGTEAPWVVLDDGSRIKVTALFQGFGLSPDFFALGVRGL